MTKDKAMISCSVKNYFHCAVYMIIDMKIVFYLFTYSVLMVCPVWRDAVSQLFHSQGAVLSVCHTGAQTSTRLAVLQHILCFIMSASQLTVE